MYSENYKSSFVHSGGKNSHHLELLEQNPENEVNAHKSSDYGDECQKKNHYINKINYTSSHMTIVEHVMGENIQNVPAILWQDAFSSGVKLALKLQCSSVMMYFMSIIEPNCPEKSVLRVGQWIRALDEECQVSKANERLDTYIANEKKKKSSVYNVRAGSSSSSSRSSSSSSSVICNFGTAKCNIQRFT